ncbi:hypothetical protein BC567DRAFT_50320 [Phyllosticta citribraziliensis]
MSAGSPAMNADACVNAKPEVSFDDHALAKGGQTLQERCNRRVSRFPSPLFSFSCLSSSFVLGFLLDFGFSPVEVAVVVDSVVDSVDVVVAAAPAASRPGRVSVLFLPSFKARLFNSTLSLYDRGNENFAGPGGRLKYGVSTSCIQDACTV